MTQVYNELTAADNARCCGDPSAAETACCEGLETLFPSGFFKALGDPNRIALMARLASCCDSKTVSELSECCPTDLSVVSRHLGTLRDAGIVESEKRGREVFYRLRYDQLASSLRQMADAIEECCTGPGSWRPAGEEISQEPGGSE